MPANSKLTKRDPIIMTPTYINNYIAKKLQGSGFYIKMANIGQELDVRAIKNNYELMIETRGNQAKKNYGTDLVFEGSQLDIHLSEQVTQIMRFQQSVSTDKSPVFIMANPDIPRLRERIAKITSGLDKLEICRFWINELDEIMIDGPEELVKILKNLL
ncbi:hypothetical protein EVU96_20065 [Bacillus infantis]|uniref:hypothetical protein n=1 Tax=Bacillus infantis TaxID=324767 RepID=UPI00101C28DB|nr:hypothetical protein [Bacillus infantis]RYI26662.1 hypothetical protein EVU96_20065 [Bacillus infantis]